MTILSPALRPPYCGVSDEFLNVLVKTGFDLLFVIGRGPGSAQYHNVTAMMSFDKQTLTGAKVWGTHAHFNLSSDVCVIFGGKRPAASPGELVSLHANR